jgi:phage baseplate assembly protein V
MYEQLLNRVKNIFGTGIATRVETGIVQLKLATGILNDRIKRVHNYGFMSRPLPGAKGYTLFVGGDTSRGITVCMEDERYQMKLEPGDVAMLDNKGNLIHFHSGGIDVTTKQTVTVNASKDVSVTCKNATIDATKTTINSETEINGNTTINGNASISGACTLKTLVVDGISFANHKHKETGIITEVAR